MPAHKSSAGPLALAYALLIVYASLYPFEAWRAQGLAPWAYLTSPWPRYWTAFDLISNLLGYGPLGFLLTVAGLRREHPLRPRAAWLRACLWGLILSALMEGIQTYLPSRVASNLDFALNAAGSALGGGVAIGLHSTGLLALWGRVRQRWFLEESHVVLALLALWPFALLPPAAIPLGLGQVLERVEGGLARFLADTPFLNWLPVRQMELQPLVPLAECVCVALGLLGPVLLSFSVARQLGHRVAMLTGAPLLALAGCGLSAALTWGPTHAWTWLSPPVSAGLLLGSLVAGACVFLSRRACVVLTLLSLALGLSLINQASASPYFAQTLQHWEQGRFVRFHGITQWLAWLWPYAALAYCVSKLSRRESAPSSLLESRHV